jgi:hypothetical protein
MTDVTFAQSDWSRLMLLAKRLSAAGLIIIGLVAGSILVGEWPHDVPGKSDGPDGHNDTTETRDGPARLITNVSGFSVSATTLTRLK